MFTRITTFMFQSLEPMTASLLPIPILLLGGIFGKSYIERHQETAFLLVLLLTALGIFFSEFLWQLRIRHRYKRQIQVIQSTCQNYLKGDSALRLSLRRTDNLFKPLFETLNILLDTVIPPEKHLQLVIKEQTAQLEIGKANANLRMAQEYITQLNNQLQKLLQTFAPTRQGNLQVRAQITPGEVGQLADFCNSVLEELTIMVHWARESSRQVQDATGNFLESVVELTQTTEIHLYSLTSTTEALGALVSFLQRLGGTLSPCLERIQRIQTLLAQENMDWLTLQNEVSYLSQTMAELSRSTHLQIIQAESLFEELSALGRQFSRGSSPLFALTDQITRLAGQVRTWSQGLSIYQISEKQPSALATPVTPPHL